MAQTDIKTTTEAVKFVNTVHADAVTDQYKINQTKFASLSDAQDFEQLKHNFIEIDIEPLMEQLGDASYFEVTVPMTGMTDFLSTDPSLLAMPQQFPTIMAINGFGASSKPGDMHYPKPYFLLAKDLVGNEYELLVDEQGHVEIPEQGLGLFSMLQSLTFIYSFEQVTQGKGLVSLEEFGAQAGKIYLLPPPDLESGFLTRLGVSHLDDYLRREVDYEMKVPVESYLPQEAAPMKTQLNGLESDGVTTLELDVQAHAVRLKPFEKLQVELEEISQVEYKGFSSEQEGGASFLGWSQVGANIFEKAVGLSDLAKLAVVRNLISEFDFTKSLLEGHNWGIENTNGFNDFGLRGEAIGVYYDLVVDAVVQSKVPGEYWLQHVPDSHFSEFDLSYVSLDSSDQIMIDELTHAFEDQDFSTFQSLFPGQEANLSHGLSILMYGDSDHLPDVQVRLVSSDQTSGLIDDVSSLYIPNAEHMAVGDFDVASSVEMQSFIELDAGGHIYVNQHHTALSLSPNHSPTTIHYQDIMDVSEVGGMIKGFDVETDQIDLNGLLEQMPGATRDNIQIQAHGADIHISIQGESGESLPVATLLGAAGPELPGDLGQIIASDLG